MCAIMRHTKGLGFETRIVASICLNPEVSHAILRQEQVRMFYKFG